MGDRSLQVLVVCWISAGVAFAQATASIGSITGRVSRCELTKGVGARFGFVYYTVRNLVGTYQKFRPQSAYTVPFDIVGSR